MPELRLRDGFVGQDMFVIPRPILKSACRHPLIRAIYPTDIGWFPNAAHHYRERPSGAEQNHLMLCVDGHGYAEIGGTEAHLQAGQILVIPKDTAHRYWADADCPWSIYWVHFLGDDAEFYTERVPVRGQPAQVESRTQQEAVRLFRYCIDALYDGYGLANLIYAASSVQHILALLMYRNKALPLDSQMSGLNKLQASVMFMQENFAKPLKLEDFAAQAGLSVSYFSESFRDHTGLSPMAYLGQLRIRHACRLLDLTGKTVKSIALESGFSDPYYFSRAFKKTMGIAPDKYRAIKKG